MDMQKSVRRRTPGRSLPFRRCSSGRFVRLGKPPFEATIKDGWIHGRGVQDDKGPSLAALYAVKALMDAGVIFEQGIVSSMVQTKKTLWRCMARYNELEETRRLVLHRILLPADLC